MASKRIRATVTITKEVKIDIPFYYDWEDDSEPMFKEALKRADLDYDDCVDVNDVEVYDVEPPRD